MREGLEHKKGGLTVSVGRGTLAEKMNERLEGSQDTEHLELLRTHKGNYITAVEAEKVVMPKAFMPVLVKALKELGEAEKITEEKIEELYRRYDTLPQPEVSHSRKVEEEGGLPKEIADAKAHLRTYFTNKTGGIIGVSTRPEFVGTAYIHEKTGIDATTLSKVLGESTHMPPVMGKAFSDRSDKLSELMIALGHSDEDVTQFKLDFDAFNKLARTHRDAAQAKG